MITHVTMAWFRHLQSKYILLTRGSDRWLEWAVRKAAADMENPEVIDDLNLINAITGIYTAIDLDPKDSNLLTDAVHWFQGRSTDRDFRMQYTLPMVKAIVKARVADSPEKMKPIVLTYLVDCGDVSEHRLEYYAHTL